MHAMVHKGWIQRNESGVADMAPDESMLHPDTGKIGHPSVHLQGHQQLKSIIAKLLAGGPCSKLRFKQYTECPIWMHRVACVYHACCTSSSQCQAWDSEDTSVIQLIWHLLLCLHAVSI